MNTLTVTPTVTYTDLYRSLALQATMGQIEAASIWYRDAEEVAEEVARNLDTTLEIGASIVSAFSPRERWSTNVSKAIAYSLGQRPKGLQNNLIMADNAMIMGFDALKGQKTNAFARAIAGDSDAIVIDVWMCRAANAATDSPSKGLYNQLCDSVRTVADECGISARTAQALIWIVKRGSAE